MGKKIIKTEGQAVETEYTITIPAYQGERIQQLTKRINSLLSMFSISLDSDIDEKKFSESSYDNYLETDSLIRESVDEIDQIIQDAFYASSGSDKETLDQAASVLQ